jgi:hypothetical protein
MSLVEELRAKRAALDERAGRLRSELTQVESLIEACDQLIPDELQFEEAEAAANPAGAGSNGEAPADAGGSNGAQAVTAVLSRDQAEEIERRVWSRPGSASPG